jgi:hypothetical protein
VVEAGDTLVGAGSGHSCGSDHGRSGGAGVGAAVGGLTGALVGIGIPGYEAKRYEGKIKEGTF